MVAKITSGAAIYGALYYNQEKVEKGKARTLWRRARCRQNVLYLA